MQPGSKCVHLFEALRNLECRQVMVPVERLKTSPTSAEISVR